MSDQMQELMEQIGSMEEALKETETKLHAMNFNGSSACNNVKVTVAGNKRLKNIDIEQDFLNQPKDVVGDVIISVINKLFDEIDAKDDGLKMSVARDLGIADLI